MGNNFLRVRLSVSTIMLLFLFLIPTLVLAQNTDSSYTNLKDGATALQFHINDNFTLGGFIGSTISFQRILSRKNAIRWGLDFNGRYSKDHANNSQRNQNEYLRIGVVMNYLWYQNIYDKIRFYYGLGPDIYLNYKHVKSTAGTASSGIKSININLDENIALQGVAGIEWFATRNTSFTAEYVPSIEGSYYRSISKGSNFGPGYSASQRSTSSETRFSINPSYVRFGVSVYF